MVEKNIMVSLGDDRIKEISEAISNKTCNKILDYLTEDEGTVSDVSEKLKMPINTVDYNIKKLVKAGLIEKSSHWWSVKGKKMPVYKVSNKKIIISPKKSFTKNFLVAFGLTGIAAWILNGLTNTKEVAVKGNELVFDAVPRTAELTLNGVQESSKMALEQSSFITGLSPAVWFLIGAWFALLLFILIKKFNERRTKSSPRH